MAMGPMLKNRNFVALLGANTILGAAFPMQLVLAGLVGLMLAPNAALATLPASVQTLAGLLAAAPISLLMGRYGRRAGFALGAGLTCVGGLAAVAAISAGAFPLLCLGHFMMGAGWAAFQYFRFAAGEVVEPAWKPVAISFMLSSLLVAALVGPQVFIVTKDLAGPLPFAGAYLAIAAIALLGLLPLAALRMAVPARVAGGGLSRARLRAALLRPAIRRAVAVAAVAQGAMVFLMIPTPIAMIACGFTDAGASDVIRWHIVAMFAPSFATGFLIKRFGAERIAFGGLALIATAALAAATGQSAVHFYGALMLLGVGWNFGFIGGTTMLEAALAEEEKAAVQGANDTVIALVSTLCAFGSGAVVAGLGWMLLAVTSATCVVAAIAVIAWDRARAAHLRPE